MERILYGLLILMVGILIGSSSNTLSCGPTPVEGLLLVDGVSSVGSSEENGSISIYNYEFTLYNSDQETIYISDIRPVLVQSEYTLSSQESVSRTIGRNLSALSSITVNGSVEMYTANLSKEQIMELRPISYINVSSTQSIPYLDEG